MSKWNGKRFSVYTSDEKSALGLIKELGEQTNYNTDEVERLTISDNKKVSHDEMQDTYKIDKDANFTGSWHGIKKPTASNEGLQSTVDKIVQEDIPLINSQLNAKANKGEIGAPLIATSIDEMVDTSKVYVNTTDGKWYSFNGTNWVAGGTYNSVAIGDGTVDFKKFDNNIQNSLCDYNKIETSVLKGYYLISNGGLQANDGYNTIIVENCVEGEKYNCDTVVKDTACAVVLFFDDSWIRQGYLEQGTGVEQRYTNYNFTIPKGATKFVVSSKGVNEIPIARKYGLASEINNRLKEVEKSLITSNNYNVYAKKINETNHAILFKYNSSLDLCIEFARCGVSNLYQIKHMYTTPNTNEKCGGSFDNLTIFKSTVSDWLSPYKVRAINNINGDNISSLNYTGGWHGYNGDQTGGATGSFISARCYVDNVELTSTNQVLGGNEIKIIVKNRINGYNTAKSDGTGRNIIEETITYKITQGRIDVTNVIEALEKVEIIELYGIQTENKNTWAESVTFYSDISKTFDFTSNQDFYDKCDRFTVKGGENYLTAFMENTGLGNRNYVADGNFYAWSRNYQKAYFNLIKNKVLTLESGQKTYYQGGYIFSYGKNDITI